MTAEASTSRLRERGYWFISEIGHFTVDAVLEWMGDLSEEKIIAKNAARRSLVKLSAASSLLLSDTCWVAAPEYYKAARNRDQRYLQTGYITLE